MHLCPRDGSQLKETEFLGVKIDACPLCFGAWLDEGELAAITYLKTDLIGSPQEAKLGKCECPICNIPMEEIYFSPDKKVLIDRCPRCKGIWCDQNEIMAAIKIADQQKEA